MNSEVLREVLREMLRRQPFIPLEIQLSSQETHTIRHPEFAMVLPSRLILGYPETDRTVTCSLIHITRVRELESGQNSPPSDRNGV